MGGQRITSDDVPPRLEGLVPDQVSHWAWSGAIVQPASFVLATHPAGFPSFAFMSIFVPYQTICFLFCPGWQEVMACLEQGVFEHIA